DIGGQERRGPVVEGHRPDLLEPPPEDGFGGLVEEHEVAGPIDHEHGDRQPTGEVPDEDQLDRCTHGRSMRSHPAGRNSLYPRVRCLTRTRTPKGRPGSCWS